MDPRTGQTSSDGKVVAFSTRDILLHLFKLSLQDRGLPELDNDELIALDTQIARIDRSIQDYLGQEDASNSPQTKINAIKTLLMEAKDSPKRKELVASITELDGKLINLNVQGEGLSQEAKKLATLFRDKIVEASLKQTTVDPQIVSRIEKDLEALKTKTEPFKDSHDALEDKLDTLGNQVASMTGRQLAEVLAQQQPAAKIKPDAAPGA